MNEDAFERGTLSNAYCPKNKDYKIAGNYMSNNFQFISVRLVKCSTGCQPDAVIENVINNAFLSIVIENSYLDFDDYDTPLKRFLDDRHSYRGLSTHKKRVKLYARENSAELSDDLIQLTGPKELEFLNLESAEVDMLPLGSPLEYFEVVLFLDPIKSIYTRTVFSFLDMFGLLGGVFEILSII